MITLSLFGSPRLARDGVAVHLDRHKALALLAYLALTRRPQARDHLAALLWPEIESSRVQLRNALASLRAALGDSVIAADSAGIHLAPGALACDVPDLLARLDAMSVGSVRPSRVDLEALIAECSAGFMAGFSLRDAPDFDAWQRAQEIQIIGTVGRALMVLAGRWIEAGDDHAALIAARGAAQIDPLHEEARRLVMRLAAWTHQRGLALKEYRAFAALLAERIGVEPEHETRALAAAIQADEPIARPVQRPLSRHDLPALAPIYGRDAALDEIARLLIEADARLVTITGASGVGKTHLAVAAAWRIAEAFPDGVQFIRLEGETSAAQFTSALMSALGVFGGLRQHALDAVIGHARGLRVLLVIDNAHNLRGAESTLTALLHAAPGVRALATAYDPLGLTIEYRLAIGGLAQTAPHAEDTSDAAQLFAHCAARVIPGFTLTPDNVAPIARLCERVGGFPLAIVLAASWCDTLTPAEINAEIARTADFLRSSHPDLPERHRSLRAVFETAWGRLSADERRTLRSLTVFQGGFGRDAAAAVAAAPLDTLRALVGKALIGYDAGARRYRLHDLFHQYAAERLTEAECAALNAAHLDYFAGFVIEQATRVMRHNHDLRWDEIDYELDNVRAAWEYACDTRHYTAIDRMIDPLRIVLQARGLWEMGVLLFDRARAMPPDAPDPRAALLHAKALSRMYHFGAHAEAALLQALTIARRCADAGEIAHIEAELGWFYVTDQRPALAQTHFERAHAWYVAHDQPYQEALVLRGLAYTAIGAHQHAQAHDYTHRSLLLRRAIGDWVGEQETLTLRGELALLAGDLSDSWQDLSAAHDWFARQFAPALAIQRTLSFGWISACLLDPGWTTRYAEQIASARRAARGDIVRCHSEALLLFMRTLDGQARIIPSEIDLLQTVIARMVVVYSTINPDLRFLWMTACFNGWVHVGRYDDARRLLVWLDEQGYLDAAIYARWLVPGALIMARASGLPTAEALSRALAASPQRDHPWAQRWGATLHADLTDPAAPVPDADVCALVRQASEPPGTPPFHRRS